MKSTGIYAPLLSYIEYLVVISQIKILWVKKTLLIMVPCPSSEKGPMFCLWFCLNCHRVKKFYMFDFYFYFIFRLSPISPWLFWDGPRPRLFYVCFQIKHSAGIEPTLQELKHSALTLNHCDWIVLANQSHCDCLNLLRAFIRISVKYIVMNVSREKDH